MIQMMQNKKIMVRYKIVMMHKGKFCVRVGLVITDIERISITEERPEN